MIQVDLGLGPFRVYLFQLNHNPPYNLGAQLRGNLKLFLYLSH